MRPRHTATGRRRTLLGLAATGLSLAAIGTARGQEAWPNKPVKIVYPYAPGGAGDPLSRAWADRLTRAYNVPFIVENRVGAPGKASQARGSRVNWSLKLCAASKICLRWQIV